jgi:O-antigen ligase
VHGQINGRVLGGFFVQESRGLLEMNTTASAEVKKQWKVKGLHFHNQFLQNFGETGIFGFTALVLMLFLSLKKAHRSKYREHYLFILMCILFFLSDSVLMRHKGIVFFVFFNLFFLIKTSQKNEAFIHNS